MGTEHTGDLLFTVEGDPAELRMMVVQEIRRNDDRFAGSDESQRGVVIIAVEIRDLRVTDQPLLQSTQRSRRTSPDHQGASEKIFFPDEGLFS